MILWYQFKSCPRLSQHYRLLRCIHVLSETSYFPTCQVVITSSSHALLSERTGIMMTAGLFLPYLSAKSYLWPNETSFSLKLQTPPSLMFTRFDAPRASLSTSSALPFWTTTPTMHSDSPFNARMLVWQHSRLVKCASKPDQSHNSRNKSGVQCVSPAFLQNWLFRACCSMSVDGDWLLFM